MPTTPLIRLGRVLFWTFSGLAILTIVAGLAFLLAVVFKPPAGSSNDIWFAVVLNLGSLLVGAILYGVGRACRYVLSDE